MAAQTGHDDKSIALGYSPIAHSISKHCCSFTQEWNYSQKSSNVRMDRMRAWEGPNGKRPE